MSFEASVRRVQREHPAWSYSECCAHLQRRSVAARKRKRPKRPVAAPVVTYWWQSD